MRLLFMGTTEFSVRILSALINNFNVVGVYTQPPRPYGRGLKKKNSAVHNFSLERSIPVQTPSKLDKNEFINFSSFKDIDVVVVVAYGLILPENFLNFSSHGCINVHASILPRWRGAAPIQRAIMEGDTETGITIMKMDVGLDTGDILIQRSISIDDTTTYGILSDKLSGLGAKLIVPAISNYYTNSIKPQPQLTNGITYADKITKKENKLLFDMSARMVVRHINALSPRPGAFIEVNSERIKLLEAEYIEENYGDAGTIVDENFTIACESGCIRPIIVQRSGREAMKVNDFLRGFTALKGTNV